LEVADGGGLARGGLALVVAALLSLRLRGADEGLGGADAQAAADDLLGELLDLRRIGRAEERARVALGELAGDDARADAGRQLEEAQRVRDRRTVLAEALRERLLRVAVLLGQAIEGLG